MKTQPLPPWPRRKALRDWLNSLRNDVQSIWPRSSHNVRVNQTTDGTSYVGVPKSEEVSSGVTFEGEYNPELSYAQFAIVVVSGGGPTSGSYISLRAVPVGTAPSYPDVGIYWRILGRTSDVSFFV